MSTVSYHFDIELVDLWMFLFGRKHCLRCGGRLRRRWEKVSRGSGMSWELHGASLKGTYGDRYDVKPFYDCRACGLSYTLGQLRQREPGEANPGPVAGDIRKRTATRGMAAKVTLVAAVAAGAWLAFNPPGRFGPSCFGYTAYNSIPRPVTDPQIRSDGKLRYVRKTHDLGLAQVAWLLEPRPDVLVVSIGWSSVVQVRPELTSLPDVEVRILPTGAALDAFNSLTLAGRAVAIHVHSTC